MRVYRSQPRKSPERGQPDLSHHASTRFHDSSRPFAEASFARVQVQVLVLRRLLGLLRAMRTACVGSLPQGRILRAIRNVCMQFTPCGATTVVLVEGLVQAARPAGSVQMVGRARLAILLRQCGDTRTHRVLLHVANGRP